MKKAIIIHCWGGTPDYCWYPDTQRTLEKAGFTVTIPVMPRTDHPLYAEWLAAAQAAIGVPDEDTYLIGHSLGCITILHYLQSMTADKKIGGAVFVAGFAQPLGSNYSEISSFFDMQIQPAKVTQHLKYPLVAIHSDNDPHVPLEHGAVFERDFGAQLIIRPGMKHFSGARNNPESCTQVPDVAEAIIRMSTQQ